MLNSKLRYNNFRESCATAKRWREEKDGSTGGEEAGNSINFYFSGKVTLPPSTLPTAVPFPPSPISPRRPTQARSPLHRGEHSPATTHNTRYTTSRLSAPPSFRRAARPPAPAAALLHPNAPASPRPRVPPPPGTPRPLVAAATRSPPFTVSSFRVRQCLRYPRCAPLARPTALPVLLPSSRSVPPPLELPPSPPSTARPASSRGFPSTSSFRVSRPPPRPLAPAAALPPPTHHASFVASSRAVPEPSSAPPPRARRVPRHDATTPRCTGETL